jgi:hypothetical protein
MLHLVHNCRFHCRLDGTRRYAGRATSRFHNDNAAWDRGFHRPRKQTERVIFVEIAAPDVFLFGKPKSIAELSCYFQAVSAKNISYEQVYR